MYRRTARAHGIEVPLAQIEGRLRDALTDRRVPSLSGVRSERIPIVERESWREIVRSALGDRGADGPCFDELFAFYGEASAWEVVSGVSIALAEVRRLPAKTAVISNMDARLPSLLEKLQLSDLLDLVVIPSNSGLSKPDPRVYHEALDRLGESGAAAIYIGDREESCVEGARNAGIRALRFDPSAPAGEPWTLRAWSELVQKLTQGEL